MWVKISWRNRKHIRHLNKTKCVYRCVFMVTYCSIARFSSSIFFSSDVCRSEYSKKKASSTKATKMLQDEERDRETIEAEQSWRVWWQNSSWFGENVPLCWRCQAFHHNNVTISYSLSNWGWNNNLGHNRIKM